MSQTPSLKRKQASISSFFAKAASPSSSNGTGKTRHNGKRAGEELKRAPDRATGAEGREDKVEDGDDDDEEPEEEEEEDDDDDDEDEVILPSRKRPRRNEDNHANSDDEPRPSPPRTTTGNASLRTERFRFQFSPLEATADDADAIAPADESANGEDAEKKQKEKEQLHQKFVRRLGGPDCLPSVGYLSNAGGGTEDMGVADSDAEAADEDETPPAPKGRGSKKAGTTKLTPMEKQVLEIKRKHLDAIVVFQVGYKFQFFGEDARVAAKELGLVCIPGKMRYDEHPSETHLGRFASASFPLHRLHVHVKRLVAADHKVGVVKQLETAALKAAGDNRNAPFVRKLTNMYTKGTYVIDDEEDAGNSVGNSAPSTGYVLCLTESSIKGLNSDEKVQVGFVAVQPATGNVIYDNFEDGFMRSEIETRLLHISPCELILVGDFSTATHKLVKHLSRSKMTVFGDSVRVERVSKSKTAAAEAHSHVSGFYASRMTATGTSEDEQASGLLDKVLSLPEHVTICLSAMIKHLAESGLDHVFELMKYFQSFSARSHMLLNGNTLINLEIYQNQTDFTAKGSLFWTLDRTKTRFGQRLLRKWVGRPLVDKSELEERVGAVEEFLNPERSTTVDRLTRLLSRVKIDLEKVLIRVYYGRCSRPELLTMLQTLQFISSEFAHVKSPADAGFSSPILNENVAILPTMLGHVNTYLDKINGYAAKKDDKYDFFREEVESGDITEHRLGIAAVEHDLQHQLISIAETLGKKKAGFVTKAGIEYLVEVENNAFYLKKVPASWRKISGTKKVSRFHTPEVVTLIRERDQHKESLAAACDKAFASLLADISTQYHLFRDCIQALATLDSLASLSVIAGQPGYVKPAYTDEVRIDVKQGRHPMVEQLLLDSYVPNDTELSTDETRALLVTGPNMGGKSSYVRQIALITIMGQIGSYVPAESATLGMLDAVYTRMGAFDNMLAGESTFMVELSETADILKQATPRSLVILDELGRGTSTHDGVAIAQSVLDYMIRSLRSLTLFITHYQHLSRLANGFSNRELRNVHMKFTESGAGGQDITFLYEVGEGVAHRSYGLNVAKLANIPAPVLDVAQTKSTELEEKISKKKLGSILGSVSRVFRPGEQEDEGLAALMGRLLDDVEQL